MPDRGSAADRGRHRRPGDDPAEAGAASREDAGPADEQPGNESVFDGLLRDRSTGVGRSVGHPVVDRLVAALVDRLPPAASGARLALGRHWWLPVLVAVGALAVAAASFRFDGTPAVGTAAGLSAPSTTSRPAASQPGAVPPAASPPAEVGAVPSAPSGEATPGPPTGPAPAPTTAAPPSSPLDASRTASPTGPAQLVVDVVGRVRRPGLVRLAAGSRVGDAVAAAGGVTPGTDVAALNLARPVADGQQIRVGLGSPWLVDPGEVVPGSGGSAGPGGGAPGTPAAGTPSPGGRPPLATAGPAPDGVVDLNTATLEQLDRLPGVGPVTAQKILDWRTQHGRFSSVDDLDEIPGIGPARLADLRPLVRVS